MNLVLRRCAGWIDADADEDEMKASLQSVSPTMGLVNVQRRGSCSGYRSVSFHLDTGQYLFMWIQVSISSSGYKPIFIANNQRHVCRDRTVSRACSKLLIVEVFLFVKSHIRV